MKAAGSALEIARQISVDACIGEVFGRCVGSHRCEVTVTTPGGNSFSSFGKKKTSGKENKDKWHSLLNTRPAEDRR